MPLPCQPDNNDITVQTPPTGFDALRTHAVSRSYLNNFDHVTAYWVSLRMKPTQVALSYGADDLHGTIIEEHIFHDRFTPPHAVTGAAPPLVLRSSLCAFAALHLCVKVRPHVQ